MPTDWAELLVVGCAGNVAVASFFYMGSQGYSARRAMVVAASQRSFARN